jgi:ABC-type multidrug transport system fused ATPase/permease subunit
VFCAARSQLKIDAYKIAQVISGIYFIYGAPFEIIIAGVYLYNLLGWSAFSGFLAIIVLWPLNSMIAKRAIRIQKGVLAARDKRMSVLNELIGAVKFIKFFAWEDRWISRVMDARKYELDWVVRMRINGVLFSGIWVFAPILVSVTSFLTFVYQGNELTVSIAFTAISLFSMVRSPLNILPAWIVYLLQAGVALDRISSYLDEEEVDGQVSTMKKDNSGESVEEFENGLGIVKGTFKWNEIESRKDGKGAVNGKSTPTPVVSSDTASGTETQTTLAESDEHRFELRDISVMFPEGQLSVITGQ